MTALSDRDRLQDPIKPRSRISREIESLRKKIADLEILEFELARAELALKSSDTGRTPTAEGIKAEIEKRLGFFPSAYVPALESPDVLENLWRQARAAYYDSPIPEIFKEKLFALLSRSCSSPYPIITHSHNLRSLGMSAAEVLQLLRTPIAATGEDMEQMHGALPASQSLAGWPEHDSRLESDLMGYCITAFTSTAAAERCFSELRRLAGPEFYSHLIAFMAYVRTFHFWVEGHPEISYQSDPLVRAGLLQLLREEPRLADFFRNYYQEYGQDRRRRQAEEALRSSEERYRELFDNANDIVYTLDLAGRLTSLNKAAERITGYSRAEVLQTKLEDLAAPEYTGLLHRMVERQLAGEAPGTYEIEILTRDRRRVALETSTHTIFRDGEALGIQGIARDVTERKKTEEALQQAKQNLEAWVHELERRTEEMKLLSEMGDMLRACLTTDEAYSVIVRVAQQIFPVEVGALYIITPSRNLIESVAVWGDASLADRIFAPDECWALRRGRTHWVEDTATGLLCKHVHQPPPRAYLCVPMMAQSEALGILYLSQPANERLTEAKVRLAVAMAEHIAMALSNLRLHETLRSQSIRDPLTGLFNRRFMEESLELRRAVRNQRSLGVIMMDLDRFKHFNDTYGHDAGDTLLRELGKLLQNNIRGEDIACRYGGEEFTLILPEGNAAITQQRAESLRAAIKRLDVQHRGQPLGRVTASMGVAVFPEHGRTGESLLKAADAALYASKDAGGDHVTASGSRPAGEN